MSRRQVRQSLSRPRRLRLTAVAALLAYVLGALGLPVPHLAKAQANGDAPVLIAFCGCPLEKAAAGCCCTSTPVPGSCCQPVDVPAAGSQVPANDTKTAFQTGWVVALSARQCQGLGTLWTDVPLALTPPPPLAWYYLWTPGAWLDQLQPLPLARATPPPAPPPRAADTAVPSPPAFVRAPVPTGGMPALDERPAEAIGFHGNAGELSLPHPKVDWPFQPSAGSIPAGGIFGRLESQAFPPE